MKIIQNALTYSSIFVVFALSVHGVTPSGWSLRGDKAASYECGIDSQMLLNGHSSGYLKSKVEEIDGFGTLRQSVRADGYRGKKIRFSALVKADRVAGWAGLWMRVDKGNIEVAFSDMHEHPVKGTTDWMSYGVIVDVPKDADEIFFGFMLSGTGNIWLNGTKFQIVDGAGGAVISQQDSIPLDKPSNLDFEDFDSAVVQWIKDHAIRLRTVRARNGFSDMEPLKKLIGSARIVELGEATHGAHEFFLLKHRMLEFLASEMGFNIFAIEANMPEAYRLNDYVLTGRGDPKTLLRGMYFWTWNTQEVLDMILWMRDFNQSGKGCIQFTGFDMQTTTVAVQIVRNFVLKFDSDYEAQLTNASQHAAAAKELTPESKVGAGIATSTIPISVAAGKKLRFSGYIKTEGITSGWAGLWWRVDGKSGTLVMDNMKDRGATGTSDWKRYEIDLPVASDATRVLFGVLNAGNGKAWFDGLAIELDGQPYQTDAVDLGFESRSPIGFYTFGKGYDFQQDQQVFHDGKQSLRIQPVEVNEQEARLSDPAIATSLWEAVLRHLDDSRSLYQQKGVSPSELAWTIQNARVVLQCMQMDAGMVSRDASMARNASWIFRRTPGAKMVLWAHDAHIALQGESDPPMGSFLRKEYGNELISFGFAFNQGSFQAKSAGHGLQNFTVQPLPDSLDSMLAKPGIPYFALDLRLLPLSGPVAEWFRKPQLSRQIGAIYSESEPSNTTASMVAPSKFDALLFVDKTTAAQELEGIPTR